MEQDQQASLRQYVWNYLSFYGEQRARTLRLFVAVGSGLSLGAAVLLRTGGSEIVVAPLGAALAILGILLWILDCGASAKVKKAEEALRHLDSELKLPNVKGGGPHVLRLLEQGGSGEEQGAKGCCGGCGESAIAAVVYALFALLGVFFAMVPYFPKEMVTGTLQPLQPPPTPFATPRATPPATPFMPPYGQPRFPRQTPPGGLPRQYPSFTPPAGFPNRPNGPTFGTPQAFPGGTPAARVTPTAPGSFPPAGNPVGAPQVQPHPLGQPAQSGQPGQPGQPAPNAIQLEPAKPVGAPPAAAAPSAAAPAAASPAAAVAPK
jgi:hypothetical protein